MNQPAPTPATPPGNSVPWQWQLIVAVVLLVSFIVIGVVMIASADSTDAVWKNRVAIFTAFQSLVFGAAGWLFGREINRVPAETARADAQEAKTEAKEQATAAAEARERAAIEETRGRALASAVTAAATAPTGGGQSHDVGFGDPQATAAPQIAALAALAANLYGQR